MRYMPSRTPASGGQPSSYAQHDPNAPTYGNIPGGRQRYYGDPNERSIHTPGSSRGQQGAFRPPTQPTEYVDHATPFFDQQHAGDVQRRADLLGGNDAYQQAKAAGDLKGQIAAMTAMRGQMQQDRFVAQGGTPETWQSRNSPDANWPVPRSPSGNYQYGPGRPGPTPPGVAQSAPPGATQGGGVRRGATPTNTSAFVDSANAPAWTQQGMPPSQNPMMEGYQGGGMQNTAGDFSRLFGGMQGGAGQVSGGQGGQFGQYGGGYNPGASTGSAGLYNDPSLYDGGQMSMEGRGGGFLPPGFGGGGRQPIDPGSYNPQPFNPYQPRQFNPQQPPQGGGSPWGNMQAGYAPFDPGQFSMPYDQYSGMGYW